MGITRQQLEQLAVTDQPYIFNEIFGPVDGKVQKNKKYDIFDEIFLDDSPINFEK